MGIIDLLKVFYNKTLSPIKVKLAEKLAFNFTGYCKKHKNMFLKAGYSLNFLNLFKNFRSKANSYFKRSLHFKLILNNKGQGMLEYIMTMALSIAIALGLLLQFSNAFKDFTTNYFGNYFECLNQTGELPGLGGLAGSVCSSLLTTFSFTSDVKMDYGYNSSNSGTYNSSNSGTYNSSNSGTYNSSNSGTYNSSNSGTYNSSNSGTYNSSNNGSYNSPNTTNYDSPNSGNYDSPNSGNYDSPNSGGYSADGSAYGKDGNIQNYKSRGKNNGASNGRPSHLKASNGGSFGSNKNDEGGAGSGAGSSFGSKSDGAGDKFNVDGGAGKGSRRLKSAEEVSGLRQRTIGGVATISKEEKEAKETIGTTVKKKVDKEVNRKNDRIAQMSYTPPAPKVKRKEVDLSFKFNFSNIIKWVVIIAILLALFFFVGGQVRQVLKGMDNT